MSAGNWKLIWSAPARPGARPAYRAGRLLPPTIACTVTPFLLKSNPGEAVLSPPVTGPRPVAHAITTCPGLDGEKVNPLAEKVVRRSISNCDCEMKYCTTARPLPELSAVISPGLRCTTVVAKAALAVPLLVTVTLQFPGATVDGNTPAN